MGYIRRIIAFRVPGPSVAAVPAPATFPALLPEGEPSVEPPGVVPPALPGPSVASGSAPADTHGSAEGVSSTLNVRVLIRKESLTFLSLCIM